MLLAQFVIYVPVYVLYIITDNDILLNLVGVALIVIPVVMMCFVSHNLLYWGVTWYFIYEIVQEMHYIDKNPEFPIVVREYLFQLDLYFIVNIVIQMVILISVWIIKGIKFLVKKREERKAMAENNKNEKIEEYD